MRQLSSRCYQETFYCQINIENPEKETSERITLTAPGFPINNTLKRFVRIYLGP